MNNIENCIIIDWFAASFPNHTVYDLMNLLSFKRKLDWKHEVGFYGYKERYSFGNISIMFNHGNPDTTGCFLEMSGQGCRTFETFSNIDFNVLFSLCSDVDNCRICRLDVAFDDHSGLLDFKRICRDTHNFNWVSRWNKYEITDSADRKMIKKLGRDKKDVHAYSVMFGTRKSEMYCRIYDKAMERGGLDKHWVRCELVLKHQRALAFILDNRDIGTKFKGVLANYLNFVVLNKKSSKNVTRLKVCKYWLKFLDNVEKISLFTKKEIEYNLPRIEKYVSKQAGNSIFVLFKTLGVKGLLDLVRTRDTKLTAQQKEVIFTYKKENDPTCCYDDFNYDELTDAELWREVS